MKMAAALAIAALAKEEVPDVVSRAYEGKKMSFGRDYIIPTPFDPRLIFVVPMAVAKAAMESGVAHIKIEDWTEYKFELRSRIAHTHF
jgi:malate dehydrogenase (oxaloacetate-decarboxylating)(NADP+)